MVKIQGKAVKDAAIITGSGLAGALLGNRALGEDGGAAKGLIIGAVAGTGAVVLSNRKEVKLPEGTEMIIKLDEKLVIPK